jgi:hypothetical protein
MFHRSLASGGHFSSTAVFAVNKEGHHVATPSLLLESNLDLDGANVLFARVEYIRKSGHNLVLPAVLDDAVFDLGALSVGYLRNLPSIVGFLPGLGARLSANFLPGGLEPFYGARVPVGAMVYLRLATAPMRH